MSESTTIVLLTLAGGGFEALGVAMIVREIAQDRRQARSLFSPITLDVHSADHAHMAESVTLGADSQAQQTVAERVNILERAMSSLLEAIETSAQATKIEMRKAIQEAAQELSRKDKERDDALRRFIHDQLTGGIGLRIAGVVSILIGIVCTTAAGILQVAG